LKLAHLVVIVVTYVPSDVLCSVHTHELFKPFCVGDLPCVFVCSTSPNSSKEPMALDIGGLTLLVLSHRSNKSWRIWLSNLHPVVVGVIPAH